jgi:AraC family transcriptional regulator, regulatory protein of adaptative response / methylated-DNA-[protein]-cysteine methyltransferase
MIAMTTAHCKSGSASGGARTSVTYVVGSCSLGAILVAATATGIAAVLLGDDPEALLRDLQDRFPRANLIGGNRRFDKRAAQVIALVERPKQNHDLPLDIRGTVLQRKVWAALQNIPVGSTASYAEIARRIGAPKAVRAVAGACAANPVAVIIPCHRVVRSDGQLSGYRWGLERKRTLLDREAIAGGSVAKGSRRG